MAERKWRFSTLFESTNRECCFSDPKLPPMPTTRCFSLICYSYFHVNWSKQNCRQLVVFLVVKSSNPRVEPWNVKAQLVGGEYFHAKKDRNTIKPQLLYFDSFLVTIPVADSQSEPDLSRQFDIPALRKIWENRSSNFFVSDQTTGDTLLVTCITKI